MRLLRELLQAMTQTTLMECCNILGLFKSLGDLRDHFRIKRHGKAMILTLCLKNLIRGDTTSPGSERPAVIEMLKFLPKRQSCFLKDVLAPRLVRDQRANEGSKIGLMRHKMLEEGLMGGHVPHIHAGRQNLTYFLK